jgi:hypothetical protein
MPADKTTQSPKSISEIATWKKALPAVGLVGGFGLGYAIKKCWGCATGSGLALAFLCSIPLGIDVYHIKSVGEKAPAPKAPVDAAPDGKTVAIVADLKALLGGDSEKNAEFNKQLPAIQAAIGKLTDTEKSAFQDTLTASKSATASTSGDSSTAVSGLVSQIQAITTKYGQSTMDSLNSKMGAIEKQFGLSLS